MKVYIGTTSEIKIQAITDVLQLFQEKKLVSRYVVIPQEVPSDVPLTPFNKETITGAKNRARTLFNQFNDDGDMFVGIESGLIEHDNWLFEECWCYMYTKDGKHYKAYSSGYPLPPRIMSHIRDGGTHKDIMDQLESELKISKKDTWGIYTKKILSRKDSIAEAFRNVFSSYIMETKTL